MKPYMPVIVVLLILVALLGAGLVTAQMLKSPQSTFNEEVNPKVEEAQRLLYQYQGGQPAIVDALDRLSKVPAGPAPGEPTTQPASAASPDEAPTPASEGRDLLAERRSELDRTFQDLKAKAAAIGGGERTPPPEFSSVEELNNRIDDNAALLDKALDSVRGAVQVTASNDVMPNPVAARLEAQLLQQKADLLRRRAKVQRVRAEAERDAFDRVMLVWQAANNTVAAIEQEIKGVSPDAPKAAVPSIPATKQGDKKPGPKGPGMLDKLKGLFQKKAPAAEPAPTEPEPTEPTAEPTTPPASDNADEQPAPADPTPAEATPPVIVAVPPLDERIKQLESQGTEVDGKIAESQKEVDRLAAAVKGLEADLAKAKTKTEEAQKQMMELVNVGVDAADPGSLQKFVDAYNKAAEADRAATHEVTALQQGLMRNAKPDAQEENEILTAPLVPKGEGAQVQPSLGLTALEADLKAAEGLLSSQQALRKLIDVQLRTLQARQKDLGTQLTQAQVWRDALAQEAAKRADAAVKAAGAAKQWEDEALDKLKEGQQAAQAATTAVNDWTQKVSEFTRKSAALGPQPQTGYMAGHATAIEGDIELERANVLAQRALGEQQREALLARIPGGKPATQPASTVDADREEALKAADAALKKFEEAAGKLGGLWTLHTQMAAANYLKASVLEGDAAAKARAAGLKEYQTATKDRGDAARDYRPMMQTLSAQP